MPAIVAQSVAASTAPRQRCWAVSVEAERTARDASAKAQSVEDAIYDLKAVNPKERKQGDLRTPIQLLEAIEAKGREVDEALARLRELTSA